MFLRRRIRWPKQFGFEIAGLGPSFVTAVEKDSVAFNSGLQAGDQILELDNHDVTNMSAKAVRTLAKHSRTQPPTLGVVSRRIQTTLMGSPQLGLGITVSETKPVTVESVDRGGPAEAAGVRKGDILLEVNGTPISSPDIIKPYLSTTGRHVALGYIPVGKHSSKQAKTTTNHKVAEGSRVKRARNLHDRMNDILGEDYEKKIAAVSVLKQYAEDRDVGTLAKALCFILKTPKQRKLLEHIRAFIPSKQQPKFDNLINRTKAFQGQPESEDASPRAHKVGERRTFQVVRENGKFGFVIKGSSPAFVETIETNGPAERAGIQQGDFIIKLNGIDVRKCSHSHLIHLLQDSGTAPILEILRSDQDGYPYSSSSLGSMSTISSASSHSDSGWASHNNGEVVDRSGRSYAERSEYLLTRKERGRIKNALGEYQGTSNIVELFECVSEILDSPSKKTLWMFIIARLPSHHQQYCINQINLPTDVLLEAVGSVSEDNDRPSDSQNQIEAYRGNVTRIDEGGTVDNTRVQPSTFHYQVDYLLTSRERSVLKKALQLYSENRNINHLFEDLDVIFDTPSKKTLWMYIIPLLSLQHKDELRERIQNPVGLFSSPYQRKMKHNQPITSSEDDEHELFSKSGERKMKTKPGHGTNTYRGLDMAIIRELEETRKALQEAKALFIKDRAMMRDNTRHVTVIPIDRRIQDGITEWSSNIQMVGGIQSDLSTNGDEGKLSTVIGPPNNKVSAGSRLQVPTFAFGPDSDTGSESKQNLVESKFSKMGGGTFNRHALTALKQLDEAVAAEVKGIEQYNSPSKSTKSVNGEHAANLSLSVSPPPAPPPPVAPPPPPPPSTAEGNKSNKGKMNVKRINWEKLDQQRVENTIWEQIGDNSDLQDVVRYLELEQQFSTKSSGQKRLIDRKNEILILNPKKAYNISILLGHLKLEDSEVKHALYQMDESILTPELVRQLLSYAPNKDEVEYFDSYSGDLEELSRPDRFTYEMSQVPGYEQRLKAVIFKENFQEKISEMKEQLQHIRKASIELRHSKTLSRLLELILAMGNYMNEGNERVGQAAGFKIKFLSQLEITKTADNKATFLHVLAETVYDKFPEVLAVGEELTAVPDAAKVSNVSLNQELQELRKVLQDISDTLEKFGAQKTSLGIDDRFQDIMGHFIAHASDEIQSLFRLNASTMEEFQSTVQYFGEDTKKITTTDLFGVFAEFITKFEKSHRENMMNKRHPRKEPVSEEAGAA